MQAKRQRADNHKVWNVDIDLRVEESRVGDSPWVLNVREWRIETICLLKADEEYAPA